MPEAVSFSLSFFLSVSLSLFLSLPLPLSLSLSLSHTHTHAPTQAQEFHVIHRYRWRGLSGRGYSHCRTYFRQHFAFLDSRGEKERVRAEGAHALSSARE